MNVSELYSLTDWITQYVIKAAIVEKYSALEQALQRYSSPNTRGSSFETEKDSLILALKETPLLSLTKDQIAVLESLGIADSLGSVGISKLEDLLYRNVIDVADSVEKIQTIVSNLQTGIGKSDQIKAGLTGCVEPENYEIDGEILIRVTFKGRAPINNVTDFKEWGKTWYEIGRGIAMAHGQAPEDIRVVGATRGSIVIELAVVASIAGTTSYIIMEGLKVAERILDLRLKAEQLREMKLKNTKLAAEIEASAEEEKIEAAHRITMEVAKRIKLTTAKNAEQISILEKSVSNLLNFVERGGEIDFIAPEEDPDTKEVSSSEPSEIHLLRDRFEEIRMLENKIALLEFKES